MARRIEPEDLVLHFLNVGFGDCCVIEFPEYRPGFRGIGIVDCHSPDGAVTKPLDYLRSLRTARPFDRVEFICATHPHGDHISGIKRLLDSDLPRPGEFWDSGFRHTSDTYLKLLQRIVELNQSAGEPIEVKRMSAGMEAYYGNVRVTVLAPAVSLRNRYASYGVDINNSSVVLRVEHCADDPVTVQSRRYAKEASADPWDTGDKGRTAVAILCGDAEFESWACIDTDYPSVQKESKALTMIAKSVNPLDCDVMKISHHGSKNSAPLAIYERCSPAYAVISVSQIQGAAQHKGAEFPHPLTTIALDEKKSCIYTTDGSHDGDVAPASRKDKPGSVVAVLRQGKNTAVNKLDDTVSQVPAIIAQLQS